MLLAAAAGLVVAAAPSLQPAQVAGAYHRHVSGAFMNGKEYGAEDVLEIVPVSPTTAYVRTLLNFGNGHVCSMYGVFDAVGADLVYRDPTRVEGEAPCVLKLRVRGPRLEFDDGQETCRGDCGARGSWGGEGFPLTARRPIAYMSRLRASRQYRDAVAEHDRKASRRP